MNPRLQDWFGVPGDSSIRGYLPGKEGFKAPPDWFALRRDGTRDEFMARMTSTGMIAHFVARVAAMNDGRTPASTTRAGNDCLRPPGGTHKASPMPRATPIAA